MTTMNNPSTRPVPNARGDAPSARASATRGETVSTSLVLGALALLVASRFVFVPDGPWEQDEAIFAAGVLDLDIVHHRPHPPGFPGWMLLGKIVNVFVDDALLSLRLLSGAASAAVALLIWILLNRRVGALLALASAATLIATPSLWVHAPRAFTSTAAVAALIGAASSWGWSLGPRSTKRDDASRDRARPRWRAVLGWSMVALALTIRPQLAPTAGVLALSRIVQSRLKLRDELLPMGVGGLVLFGVFAWAIADSGGWTSFWTATRAHLSDHAGVAGGLTTFQDLGVTRGLGGIGSTVILGVLGLLGLGMECRADLPRGLSLCALWGVTLMMVLGAHHPGFPRYSVPLVVITWIPATLAVARVGRASTGVLSLLALPWFAFTSLRVLEPMASQPLPPVATLRDIARTTPPAVAFSHGMFSFARLASLDGTLGDTPVIDVRSPAEPPRLPPGTWALTGRSLNALPGNTVCEIVHDDFPSAAARLSQGRFTRARAYRDAVLLGDGHHHIERTEDGLFFAWWSDHAEVAPPAGADLLTLRILTDAVHAPIPWEATCDGRPVDEGVLTAGVQNLNLNIRGCRSPIRVDVSKTFQPHDDGRVLSARLLSAWASGPGIAAPAFRFSPGQPASMQAVGVSFEGVYNAETFGQRRRGAWTGPRASWRFPARTGTLAITMARPPHTPGPVRVRAGAEVVSLDVTATPQRFELPMRDQHGLVTVEIESPSFIPSARAATSRDGRSLGVIVFEVEVNPAGVGARCPSSP